MQPLKNKRREDCKCRTDAAAVKWRAVASSEHFPEFKNYKIKKSLGAAEIKNRELVHFTVWLFFFSLSGVQQETFHLFLFDVPSDKLTF